MKTEKQKRKRNEKESSLLEQKGYEKNGQWDCSGTTSGNLP